MSGDPPPPGDPDRADGQQLRVTRRRLLVAAGTLGAAGLVTAGGIAVVGGSTSSTVPPALAANLAELPGVEHLRVIGEAVEGAGLLDLPLGQVAATVAPAGVAGPIEWCTRTEPGALRDHVAGASADDFTASRVLEVDGWRLARSEAALAVLVARR